MAITNLAGASTIATTFAYDGQGRRRQIIEWTNGTALSTNKYLWVGTELSEERDATGATVTKRFFGQGEQIGGTNYYFTRDHLGSVREMTDGTGAIRARYDYDPYGRTTKVSGDMDADFGFTGHYYQARSGLYLALYRAYDPETGRWISKDPSGEQSGLNLYAYVNGDPANFIDGLGLIRWLGVLSSTVGIISNSFGFAGGVALGVGTSWSGVGAVAGGVIAVKSGYGVGVNFLNLIDALNDREASGKDGLINDVAAKVLPCNEDAQKAASALDLVLDLAGGQIAKSAQTLSMADRYGNVILQGGAKLGPTFNEAADAKIEVLAGIQSAQTFIQTIFPEVFGE